MKLSVVIPTLDEAETLASTFESLPPDVEVIVSDGGSSDETTSIASHHGARVVTGATGRAPQMNLGAKAATGDVLLFLHADCVPSSEAARAIQLALVNPRVVGGSFRLQIRDATLGLRLAAFVSNLRARYLRMPYGDQGLFVRRSVFEEVGGFPDVPFMEDVAIVRRLRRVGRLVRLNVAVTTGSRHWDRLGTLATTLLNWTMVTLYLCGVSPARLLPYYRYFRRGGQPSEPLAQLD